MKALCCGRRDIINCVYSRFVMFNDEQQQHTKKNKEVRKNSQLIHRPPLVDLLCEVIKSSILQSTEWYTSIKEVVN